MLEYILFIFLLYMFLKFQINKIKNIKYKSNTEYIELINKYKM